MNAIIALAGIWVTLAPLQQARQELAVAAAVGKFDKKVLRQRAAVLADGRIL